MKTALVIGAGPAGLTAAYELLKKTGIKPVVVEAQNEIGGIAATHIFRGNRIDIGGHRFFSKDTSILAWWKNILPLQGQPSIDDILMHRDRSSVFDPNGCDPEKVDNVMLVRPRKSSILFRNRLFDYPLRVSPDTLSKLGLELTMRFGIDYFVNRLNPVRPEKNLEDFFINRFGRSLYRTFFKHYTEKVWGISCSEIPQEWGSQRVKGISFSKLLRHALSRKKVSDGSGETSLISQFFYPKLGPGQLWNETANRIRELGGEVHTNTSVKEIRLAGTGIAKVTALSNSGLVEFIPDYVFSSMPLKDLVAALAPAAPESVRSISDNLVYRDFIMTGILAKSMKQVPAGDVFPNVNILPDTWIYIQEPDMISGRLQIYNNWSPYMVADRRTAWLGLEFFCNEGDSFWSQPDARIVELASDELSAMNLVAPSDVIDGTCIRVRKAYPAYWGGYASLDKVKKYLLGIENLFCIGRNGQHRYNNMDHSMLTAIASVNCISEPSASRESVWSVNTGDDYGER